jgi:DNA-nicking Smr family endonuclease
VIPRQQSVNQQDPYYQYGIGVQPRVNVHTISYPAQGQSVNQQIARNKVKGHQQVKKQNAQYEPKQKYVNRNPDLHNEQQNKVYHQGQLDLHGFRVEGALYSLDFYIKELEENGKRTWLRVITGQGNHSEDGIAKIKPKVLNYFNMHHYKYRELNPGAYKVFLKGN